MCVYVYAHIHRHMQIHIRPALTVSRDLWHNTILTTSVMKRPAQVCNNSRDGRCPFPESDAGQIQHRTVKRYTYWAIWLFPGDA